MARRDDEAGGIGGVNITIPALTTGTPNFADATSVTISGWARLKMGLDVEEWLNTIAERRISDTCEPSAAKPARKTEVQYKQVYDLGVFEVKPREKMLQWASILPHGLGHGLASRARNCQRWCQKFGMSIYVQVYEYSRKRPGRAVWGTCMLKNMSSLGAVHRAVHQMTAERTTKDTSKTDTRFCQQLCRWAASEATWRVVGLAGVAGWVEVETARVGGIKVNTIASEEAAATREMNIG